MIINPEAHFARAEKYYKEGFIDSALGVICDLISGGSTQEIRDLAAQKFNDYQASIPKEPVPKEPAPKEPAPKEPAPKEPEPAPIIKPSPAFLARSNSEYKFERPERRPPYKIERGKLPQPFIPFLVKYLRLLDPALCAEMDSLQPILSDIESSLTELVETGNNALICKFIRECGTTFLPVHNGPQILNAIINVLYCNDILTRNNVINLAHRQLSRPLFDELS